MSQEFNDHSQPTVAPLNANPPREGETLAFVRWTDPEGQTQERPIDCPLSIGRHASNLLALPDPERQISRRHALIAPTDVGDYTLTDLGSANGTLLNNRQIVPQEPVTLHDGDLIAIGPTILTFVWPPLNDPFFAVGLTFEATNTLNLPRPIVGWLELPDGKRRLLDAETRIGRAAKNNITLEDDSQISRHHATIRHLDTAFILSDLGSANGVRVNGEPVLTPRELRDNDRIEIGNTPLRFILAPLSEIPGETGFVSQVGFDLGGGSRTNLFDLLGGDGGAPRGNLREVTTLFADMRGSTALSERLNNPEQTTVIINKIFDALTAEIVRYDGWVVKFAGDNIMAIFGAPRAHEDDPERCVKAALAMLQSLDKINRQLRRQLGLIIEMRVGIASGHVVYGEVGGGDFRRLDVMGPSVNLASRLEHASRVGYITVSEAIYTRARRSFVFTPLPPQELKGVRGLIQAYEAVRERGSTEVIAESVATDYLIGREKELVQLRALLDDVRGGQGRLLAIVGDAGIGKSQLLAAFRRAESAAEGMPTPNGGVTGMADHDWIIVRAISYESAASYALLGNVIRALLGLDGYESLDRDTLAAAIGAALPTIDAPTRAEYLALVGQLLGVRVSTTVIAGADARVRRRLLMSLVRALVRQRAFAEGRNHPRPLVIALEEMQWADSASTAALDELVETIASVPLLLLLTYRPEWTHSWTGRSFYRQLNLAELTPEQSRLFLRNLLGGAQLDDGVAERIIAQCGNNPLLLEETVKALQARNILIAQGGWWTLTTDLSAMNMPSTLVGLMMARLDRLSEEDRRVVQRAAVIGRSFTYRLLAMVTGLDDALDESLDRLQDAELIVEDSLATEPEYRFKQAIVQEIAYNNVLERERRELHGQVATALEEISVERTDDQVEMLAYHYNRSANRRKAIDYLLLSGEHARRLFANSTALVQFEEALAKLRGLTAQELADEPTLPLRIHEALGDLYLVEADFARAQERYEAGLATVGTPLLDRARLWQKLGRLWEHRGEGRRALGSFERGLALLSGAAPQELIHLQASAARAYAMLGEYARVTEMAEAVLAVPPREGAVSGGVAPRRAYADARHALGLAAYARGGIDESIDQHLRALILCQDLGDAAGMQESYHELGALYWSRGQIELAFEHLVGVTTMLRLGVGDTDADQFAQRRQARDLVMSTPLPAMGDASGELAPIERYYRSGLATAQQLGDRWGMAQIGYRIGLLLFRQGEYDRAIDYLRKALNEAERIGAREVTAATSIALGTILVGRGDFQGLQYLERGVAIAEAIESALTLTEGRLRLADARRQIGDDPGAAHEEQTAFLLATRLGHQFALGLTHRIMGRIAAGRQNWPMADRHFRLAHELYTAVDAQYELGRTLADFAAMWHFWSAAGNGAVPEGATVMLQQAAQIFARLDMQTDLRGVRELLAR